MLSFTSRAPIGALISINIISIYKLLKYLFNYLIWISYLYRSISRAAIFYVGIFPVYMLFVFNFSNMHTNIYVDAWAFKIKSMCICINDQWVYSCPGCSRRIVILDAREHSHASPCLREMFSNVTNSVPRLQ